MALLVELVSVNECLMEALLNLNLLKFYSSPPSGKDRFSDVAAIGRGMRSWKKNVGRQSFTEILSGVDLGSFDKELTDRLNISRGKQHATFRAPRSWLKFF